MKLCYNIENQNRIELTAEERADISDTSTD